MSQQYTLGRPHSVRSPELFHPPDLRFWQNKSVGLSNAQNVAVFHRDKRVVVDDDRYTFTLDFMNFSEVLELHEYEINVRRYEVFETLTQPDP